MAEKKTTSLNGSVDQNIPINSSDPMGFYEWRWLIDGVEQFNIHATNDGSGVAQEQECRITGVGLFNDELSVSGLIYAVGGLANYGDLTTYGYSYFIRAVEMTDGLYVSNGTAIFDNSATFNADLNHTQGNANFDSMVRVQNNIVIGIAAPGDDALKTLALHNSATAPTNSVNLAHLFAKDIAAGRATLAMVTEEPVNADIGLASTHSGIIFWNGAKYKIPLTLVP